MEYMSAPRDDLDFADQLDAALQLCGFATGWLADVRCKL
jgi:hypothetical protein